jgi:MFS family permease
VLCVAQFVVVLDATIVATALPAIGADLGFAAAQLGWVITAYTVAMAGLLVLGGRVADLVGARRTFAVGLVVFTAASAACALAGAPGVLVGARIVQGVGAALLSPAALAALNDIVEPGAARRRALGWWTAAAAGGGASGWVLGGVITEFAGWRWVFAINAPIGVVTLVLAARLLAPARRTARSGPTGLDLGGAVSITLAVALAALGLSWVAATPAGWPGWTAVVVAAAALVFFVRHESRTAAPLVPGDLASTPGVLGGNLTAAALTACTTPAMLTTVLYVQNTLHVTPARASLYFPAFNLAVIAGSLLGPRVLGRVGARAVLVAGFLAITVGILALLTLPAAGRPAGTLIGAFVLMGAGLGAASVASTTAGTAEVDPADQGVAAGLLSSAAQVGTALSLAVITPLVASAAPMTGYRRGFAAAALVALVGAIAARAVPRSLAGSRRAVEVRMGKQR